MLERERCGDGETAETPRSLRHNELHCSGAAIRADMELGPENKRSMRLWTQQLQLRFTPNPGLEGERGGCRWRWGGAADFLPLLFLPLGVVLLLFVSSGLDIAVSETSASFIPIQQG